jgi:hypothetical protein
MKMSLIKTSSLKPLLILSACILLSLNSCDTDYAGFSQSNLQISAEVMPTDIWIVEALQQIDSLDKIPETYSVIKDFGEKIGTSKLHFYGDNSLGKAFFSRDSIGLDEMYFENGRLIFSLDKRGPYQTPCIVAYANKKPYAAAIKDKDGQWKATTPSKLELDILFVENASSLAIQAELEEKNPDYVYRIKQLGDTIIRQLAPALNEQFVMNVMKGDPIALYLKSDSENVFFTIGPKDGVNMERRNWKGNASETGDLLITVFSTASETTDYTLIAKRLVDKPQLSLQSIR